MPAIVQIPREIRETSPVRQVTPPGEAVVAAPAISVCHLEEEQVFRAGCQHYMAASPNIELRVSMGFPGGDPALAVVLTNQPDVLMLGVTHLDQRALDFVKDLQKTAPGTGIILAFTHAPDAAVFALREVSRHVTAGFAFLPKHSLESAAHLIQLVEAVAAGRVIMDPVLMGRLLSMTGRQSSFLEKLSKRELEIIELIAQGMNNQDIADVLFLERKTVERHINSIYAKLNGENVNGHVRVKAVLAYLTATGRIPSAA